MQEQERLVRENFGRKKFKNFRKTTIKMLDAS